MKTIIPAQPGFYARWGTQPVRFEPVIAWLIEFDLDDSPEVTPLGVHGFCDSSAMIVDPRGMPVLP